jgi:transcription termination factor Rho
VAAEALEQSVLESKDKDQLLAIAKALGVKASSRTKKADLIGSILETTGASGRPVASPRANDEFTGAAPTPDTLPFTPPGSLPLDTGTNGDGGPGPVNGFGSSVAPAAPAPAPESNGTPAPAADGGIVASAIDADGEPPAEWELDIVDGPDAAVGASPAALEARGPAGPERAGVNTIDGATAPAPEARGASAAASAPGAPAQQQPSTDGDGGESRNRRRRRRRKGGRGADGPQGDDSAVVEAEPIAAEAPPAGNEPVAVEGYLDMRDEGYGFLRVKGYLASRDDAYIPVKLARQYGLRKGDHITGISRPAGRNEKNPALLEVLTVNGGDPEAARRRPRFEDLTALFPDQNLRLEDPSDPGNMTARIIDLISPIGKGQRGIIVSPPKAGKTTVMKTIAQAIERNNTEVKLIVLLIDERPEEVTDMRRSVRGEVVSSTFDRPSDEHTHVAELVIEKAKRLVETGRDVVVILDGITRLSRAYNLAAPASGRILSGGIDAGALYPPKKFFGAARNVEEGGSLTILATALVDTNSRMDEAIFEEFKGTGNMELRLDRRLAERRIYPAIDVDASSTRHEELLFDRKQLQMVWKLRRVLSGLAADGNAAPGLELLIDRLKTFRTNSEFLNEIAKQPSM